jgi:hypothetical protein
MSLLKAVKLVLIGEIGGSTCHELREAVFDCVLFMRLD